MRNLYWLTVFNGNDIKSALPGSLRQKLQDYYASEQPEFPFQAV